MVVVGSLRLVKLIGIADVLELVLWLRLGARDVGQSLRIHHVEVPDVDKAVARASSGQNPSVWVPFGEENVAFVLVDHLDA